MTTPLPPKRKAAREARVWKAWAVANTSIAGHLFTTGGPLAVYRMKGSAPAFMLQPRHGLKCVPVEIREVLPAPRAGKAKGGKRG